MGNIKGIVKKEPVLIISAVCAVISMFFVPPTKNYLSYMDFKVLAILFCLMAVIAGFGECGFFDVLGQKLLRQNKGMRFLRFILVALPFFTSMVITNDVALITFVPFAIAVLTVIKKQNEIIFIVVMQTIAANLGSMATPVGNPQSLFLFNNYDMQAGEYFALVLPYVIGSFAAITAVLMFKKNAPVSVTFENKAKLLNKRNFFIYIALFALCLICVFRGVDYIFTIIVTVVCLLIFSRKLFKKVDYSLLLTFVCFFIFSGNLGNIPEVKQALSDLLNQNTVITSAIASQVVSNVPAAVLLSEFTSDAQGLVIGTNIGGLGTIIASLASLISLKFYMKTENAKTLKYMGVFTLFNVTGLVILLLFSQI